MHGASALRYFYLLIPINQQTVKKFRIAATAALILLCSVSITAIFSCKDKCGSTTCQNGGTCTDNKCVCSVGYSGNACQTAWTDQFVATYNCYRGSCTPASTGGAATWQSAVTKASTDGGETITISNFASSNITVSATVDTLGKMRIGTAGAPGISGNGSLANDTIKVDYTLSTAAGVGGYNCNFIMVRIR